MKIRHLAAIAFLSASAICSTGAVGIVARQFTIERSAAQVVIDTNVAARLQGLSDAIGHIPVSERHALLSEYGLENETALETALKAQRHELDIAQQARAAELSNNDKRLAGLLLACALSAIVSIMGAVTIYDAFAARQERVRGLQQSA